MSVEPKRIPFDEFIRDAPALFDDMATAANWRASRPNASASGLARAIA